MTTSARKENRWRKQLKDENDELGKLSREMEIIARGSQHRQPTAPVSLNDQPKKSIIRRWMRVNAADYEGPTQLTEGANTEFTLPEAWLDDETHWIWDLAANCYED